MATELIASKAVLPPATVGVVAALFLIGGIGPNSLLALFAIVVLLFGAVLLWRPAESPILLFVFSMQWLQASIKVFQANWLGVDVATLFDDSLGVYVGHHLGLAIFLSLLGLVSLALGMRAGAGGRRAQDHIVSRNTACRHPLKLWFYWYGAALFVATMAQGFAWTIPALSQPLLAMANLKWAFFWMLAYATLTQAGGTYWYWLIALGVELVMGAGGYFADFKTPLLFSILAAVTARVRLSSKHYIALASLGALLLVTVFAWSAIKEEYRAFVSGGRQGQNVTVAFSDRVVKLGQLVTELNENSIARGAQDTLSRLSYVDLFGIVLGVVPRTLPHEYGGLWWDAITRPIMPRLFFPEKSAIIDSERTNYYTGLSVAGQEQGTSISLGYMAESYIDFGLIGMMMPIFALGLFLGRFYRWMLQLDPSRRLLGMALATATLFGAYPLESSITKSFGGLVVSMLVSWIVLRFIAPRFFPRMRS